MEVIPSQLAWPWALVPLASAALVLIGWWVRRPRSPLPATAVPLAHAEVLRSLPRFQELARRHRRLGLLAIVGSLVVLGGAAAVVARPQYLETSPRESRARDLMLCLDASASMDDDNAIVVRELRAILDRLEGDRVGLMIWSSAGVLVFPLTDDYEYVRSQLGKAEQAFTGHPGGFYDGVDLPDEGASLIGDGIVSCARRFDGPEAARTRVLIVTSDNDPLGKPAFTLPEATAFAADHRVLVYGIGAPSLEDPERAAARTEFETVAAETGGVFTLAGRENGAELISSRIQDLARARDSRVPRTTAYDTPYAGAAVAGTGLLLLAWTWLAQRRRTS